MDINAIGEGDAALLCHTDNLRCCRGSQTHKKAGEWYYPNGTKVGIKGLGIPQYEFYRDREMQVVRLNHRQGNFIERGHFRCEIPDSSNMNQTVYVHIGISFKPGPYGNLFVYSINSVLYTTAACIEH